MTTPPPASGIALGERIYAGSHASVADYINFLKHCRSYAFAAGRVAGRSVIDLGCGSGYGARELSAHAGRVLAVDIDAAMCASLEREHGGRSLTFQAFDGARIPTEDNRWDAVVSFQVIEHVPDPSAYLREIHRVLKPGGEALITTPNRRVRLLPLQKPWNPYHLREYSYEQLSALLATVFGAHTGYSMLARPEVAAIDLERVRQSPLNVYLLHPLKSVVKKCLPFLAGRSGARVAAPPDAGELKRYSVDDFRYEAVNDPRALDLLFVATK